MHKFNDFTLPTEIKCLWCGKTFHLIPREIWYNANFCPSCHSPMGDIGQITILPQESLRKVISYLFEVKLTKSQVLPFLTQLFKHSGSCLSVSLINKSWVVKAELQKAFDFPKIEWKNPTKWIAC